MGINDRKTCVIVKSRSVYRGDIYYADLCGIEGTIGSEQTGRRPVLVIQNDVGNVHSPTTIVAILTTKIKRNLPTHVVLPPVAGLVRESAVCLEQIKTIDKSRLEEYRGNIGTKYMREVEKALSISVGANISASNENLLIREYREENTVMMRKETKYDSVQNDWLKQMEEHYYFFSNIKQYVINLKLEETKLDEEIEAILDYTEDSNYNAVQGYKIYKLLRERRTRQNYILKEIELLEAYLNKVSCDELSKTYQEAIGEMQQIENRARKANIMQELLLQEVG